MDYKHFLEILISKIKNNYPDAEVEVHSITKNNGIVLDGVVIREEDKRISPTIYLQSFYERVTDDDSIDNVISEIICMYERHKGDEVLLGVVDCISDFSEVSSNIYYQVITLLFEPVAQNMSDVLIEMMRLKGIEESELLDSLYLLFYVYF